MGLGKPTKILFLPFYFLFKKSSAAGTRRNGSRRVGEQRVALEARIVRELLAEKFEVDEALLVADRFRLWQERAHLGTTFRTAELPGEPERVRRAARQRDGIPLDRTTWTQLLETARSVGCPAEEAALLAQAAAT